MTIGTAAVTSGTAGWQAGQAASRDRRQDVRAAKNRVGNVMEALTSLAKNDLLEAKFRAEDCDHGCPCREGATQNAGALEGP